MKDGSARDARFHMAVTSGAEYSMISVQRLDENELFCGFDEVGVDEEMGVEGTEVEVLLL